MTKMEEEAINTSYSHNQDIKKVRNDVNIETNEITKTPVPSDNISLENTECCHSNIDEISYIKENIHPSIDKETLQNLKKDKINFIENDVHEDPTLQQEKFHSNEEILITKNKELESHEADSSCIDFDIIFNTEYDLKDTKDGSINENEHAITTVPQSCEALVPTTLQNNYIVVYPIVPVQTNQSIVELDFYSVHENTTPLRRFKSKLKNLFKRIKESKIFARKFWFIWNLIALFPLLFITNKVIFSQMCLVSTLYKNEMKNYTFVLSAIIVMLFSKNKEIPIDSYDAFFNDAELKIENVFNTTKKKVYYLSEWDFSHLPENPITQQEKIDPIMEELQTKFKTFDFLRSPNITINGSIKRSILFQVKRGFGNTNLEIINIKTDKFMNDNIKKGVELTARLLPVVIVVEKHIFIFFMEKSIKIDREMNFKNHMMFIFYPDTLVSYLERIMLSQVPIPRNSINRYINVHLLNECDLYFLNL